MRGFRRCAWICCGLMGVAGFLASCGPISYPKDRLTQSVVRICKEEYGLEVKAQFVETTLGAMVSIPGLVDELRRRTSGSAPEIPPVFVEGRHSEQGFDFRVFTRGQFVRVREREVPDEGRPPEEPSEPIRKLQKVSTAMMRVCLSTDAPVEFYRLIARDPGPESLDVILSGHILDSKRVQFYSISVGELQGRHEISVRRHPEEVGRQTVAGFLRDLRRRPLPQLLSRYTAPSKRFGELLPMVMGAALVLKGQEEDLLDEEWPARQIKRDVVLVNVPLKGIGEPGALLFTVHLPENEGFLLAIDRWDAPALPQEYQYLGPPERWEEFFYLEPVSLPDFLTEQIAKRVMTEFKPVGSESNKVPEGKLATADEVTHALAGAAAYVFGSYDFKDFQEIKVVDALKGTRWVISASDLSLYQRRNPPELKPIQ